MSKLTQFTVTGKEKDDFYGFHRIPPSKTVHRTVTKREGTLAEQNDSIYEYSLSSAYNVSSISFTTTTSLVRRGAENENQVGTSNIQGISFNNDGTKMFACDIANKRIIQYTLTSAFDTTTLLYARELSVSARGDCQSVTFNNDGSKMYVINNAGNAEQSVVGGKIDEYALSSNYMVDTATYTDSLDISGQDANAQDLYFNNVARGAVNAGGLCFVVGNDGNDVNEYLLGTEYDISTASFVDAHVTTSEDAQPRALAFDNDGDRLYVVGSDGNEINQYPLVTGFDISTTQAVSTTQSLRTNTITPRGFSFNNDGTKLYVVGKGGTLCIDGGDDENPITHIVSTRNTMKMYEGNTYIFDVSDNQLKQSDFKFSTTSGGTKEGGSEYTTDVTTNGTIGNAGATVTIVIPKKTPSPNPGSAIAELFYYESNFTDTGGKIFTPEWKGELQITKTDGSDNIETRYETKEQEDIFEDSFFLRAGLTFSVDNGDLKVELN